MAYWRYGGRISGRRKRLARIQLTARDKWFAVLLAALIIIAMMAGAWLGFNFED
jgi:hypothetical protein